MISWLIFYGKPQRLHLSVIDLLLRVILSTCEDLCARCESKGQDVDIDAGKWWFRMEVRGEAYDENYAYRVGTITGWRYF